MKTEVELKTLSTENRWSFGQQKGLRCNFKGIAFQNKHLCFISCFSKWTCSIYFQLCSNIKKINAGELSWLVDYKFWVKVFCFQTVFFGFSRNHWCLRVVEADFINCVGGSQAKGFFELIILIFTTSANSAN